MTVENANNDAVTGFESPTESESPTYTVVSRSAMKHADASTLSASGCAIGAAKTGTLEAMGSAIGMATVEDGFVSRFSVTPLTWAKGDASITQSYASALVAGGTVEMHQSLAPVVAGRVVHVTTSGSGAVVASQAEVNGGFVGIVLAGRTELSDNTRVMFGTRAALIIGAALLGGFGLIAIAVVIGVRRLAALGPLDMEAIGDLMPWRRRD
ncbi:MAG: hypothetical protein U1E26_11115 [Coriobacteriia bacterium]|nr:hypothetical protein [Coriobacteriia bacterium]